MYALHQDILATVSTRFPLPTSLLKISKISKVYSAPSTWTWNSCFTLPMGLLAVHWYDPSSAAVTWSIFNTFPKFSVSGSSLGRFPVTLTQLRWGVGLIAKKKKKKRDLELKPRLLHVSRAAALHACGLQGDIFRDFWALLKQWGYTRGYS